MGTMTTPFSPVRLRDLDIPNRLWMSPMCTYSAEPEGPAVGAPTDFHLTHYGARAAGGAGLVMIEATGVQPEGRISPFDLGLWDDDQIKPFSRIADAIIAGGAVPGIQLAHAGRKASVDKPWLGGAPLDPTAGGWTPQAPSPVAFPGYPEPAELTEGDITTTVQAFADAARRALKAGIKVAEVHAAHGYLLHSFLSPISNTRRDGYGGDLAGRARFAIEVIDAVRAMWPSDLPVFLRISTTDWISENPSDHRAGWTLEDSVELAGLARDHGIDLIDCSSGGTEPIPIPHGRDYQTANAQRLRSALDIPVAAVGRIDDPEWAAELIRDGHADALFIGRPLLRDPSWVNNAARTLRPCRGIYRSTSTRSDAGLSKSLLVRSAWRSGCDHGAEQRNGEAADRYPGSAGLRRRRDRRAGTGCPTDPRGHRHPHRAVRRNTHPTFTSRSPL